MLSCVCTVLCYIHVLDKKQKPAEIMCLLSTCKTRPNTLPDLVDQCFVAPGLLISNTPGTSFLPGK